jgi:hypothetical protein
MTLVSMLSVPNVFYANREPIAVVKAKKRLGAKEGDHVTLINIYIRYEHIRSNASREYLQFLFFNFKKIKIRMINESFAKTMASMKKL